MRTLSFYMPLRWLSAAALLAAWIIYALTDFSIGGSSPLALLLMGTCGWLLQRKEALTANLLLLVAGGSLLLFPFLYDAPLAYSPLALPVASLGIMGLAAWWKEEKDDNKSQ